MASTERPLQDLWSHSMKRYGEHRFPGKLFVVEGIDGSGKSTQLMLLHQWLKAEGYGVVFSEWNSSPLVRDITKRGKKTSETGPEVAWEVIKQKLLEIIGNEDKTSPLSDEDLVMKLQEAGYPVARRTVTKYRKMLRIPSSRQRKDWTLAESQAGHDGPGSRRHQHGDGPAERLRFHLDTPRRIRRRGPGRRDHLHAGLTESPG